MKQEIEMLDALFRNATEGIIVTGKNATIVMVNPKAEELFGFTREELAGKTIEALIPQRFSKDHVNHRNGFMKNPHARAMGIGMDLYAMRKDGSEFPVEVSLSHFTTSEGQFFMSFIIDITERKKQEDEIREANDKIVNLNADLESRVAERTEELANAINRLAESKQEVMRALEKERELNELKSRFVTTASHEFRTPLATILSSASLIAKYPLTEDDSKREKHINRIKTSVNHLTQILNDFLSLSKLEEGMVRNEPVVFQVKEFIHDLIEEVKGTIKEGQQIIHEGESGEVTLDAKLLRNVLLNLLSNAAKYSPENSNIIIHTLANRQHLTVAVKDNGIGIPDEDKGLLFERFFRAQNAGNVQGTGLGLNIVKRYMDLMRGEISFESQLHKGTTFTVKIPNNTLTT